ncbi:hypothetical protein QAD02_007667 [Eretmocerus hayati]|uniref:Uncharacterized protein n=1 Tax=Eretmocerus hayati TaxID=131215 RepID=A0ACC2N4A3_9HYME|nr:hypothetical protein QAD02_007667 [Eretmocerus hayati]
MEGKKSGVQKRILDMSPLASYAPCGSHSLNLVLCDAAQSSVKSVSLFGYLQRLLTLFSASPQRWEILTEHCIMLTLERLSDTRWEAKVGSVKAVRYQISEVHDALSTLAEKADQKEAANAAARRLSTIPWAVSSTRGAAVERDTVSAILNSRWSILKGSKMLTVVPAVLALTFSYRSNPHSYCGGVGG